MHISNKQKVALSSLFKDAAGAVVVITGVPSWSSSDTSVIALTTAADGLSTSAVSVDNSVGTSVVTLTLGSLSATVTIDVSADGGVGTATSAEIVVGPVSDK